MGTRANVIIIGQQFQIVLYRHWDGYPAETGAALLQALGDKATNGEAHGAAAFVSRLLAQGENGRKDFELTDALHGDIEHVYQVHWSDGRGSALTIKHAEVSTEAEIDNWREKANTYTPESFRAFVNTDRTMINHRIAEMRRRAGKPAPTPDEQYAMV